MLLAHCWDRIKEAHRQHMRVPKMSYFFGPHLLQNSQIFFESPLSLAVVNLKPIVPGHVLIIPKRVEPRVMMLNAEEYIDLFLTARTVGPKLEQYYRAEAMNIAIQDGASAGQSVAHVHIHLLPRKAGDFKRNDDVYEHLEGQDLQSAFHPDRRTARTMEEMANESNILRALFTKAEDGK